LISAATTISAKKTSALITNWKAAASLRNGFCTVS
jgi:hypothetical protein